MEIPDKEYNELLNTKKKYLDIVKLIKKIIYEIEDEKNIEL